MGELYNALRMGRQLARECDVKATYVVPDAYEGFAAAAGFDEHNFPRRSLDSRLWLRELIEHLAPELLVLADHENLALERSSIDHGSIYDSACPVVVVDSLQFAPAAREVEYALARVEGAERLRRWLPPRVTVPAVPDSVPVLTPIPVASPKHAINPFSLYQERPQAMNQPSSVREELGIPHAHKLVVAAQSGWASAAFEQLARGTTQRGLYDRLRTRRLVRAIAATGYHVTLVQVGAAVGLGESTDEVTIRRLPRLRTQDFTDLVAAADLYATDNLISGAMAQAAILGTPVMAFVNSGQHEAVVGDQIDELMERAYPGWGFPYLVNPFGWHEELAPVVHGNPYLESVLRAEIFDQELLAAAFAKQLGITPDHRAGEALGAAITSLPPLTTVLASLVKQLEPTLRG